MSSSAGNLRHLHGLRALAALYVVVHHLFIQASFQESQVSGPLQRLAGVFGYGHYAVDFFIILSGFCLAIPYARETFSSSVQVQSFYKRRALRILPPYAAAIAVCLCIIMLMGPGPESWWSKSVVRTPWQFWSHVLMVHDLFRDTAWRISPVLWSISVEWRIYFLFPLLILCWQRFGGVVALLVSACCSGMLAAGLYWLGARFPEVNTSPTGPCPWYLLLFTLGMLASDIALSDSKLAVIARRAPWGALTFLSALLVFAVPKLKVAIGGVVPWEVLDVCVGLFSVCLLIVSTVSDRGFFGNVIHGFAGWSPLANLGVFAYSIYLIHTPVLELVWRYGFAHLHASTAVTAVLYLVVALPASVVAAYAFFVAFERPFLSRKIPSKQDNLSNLTNSQLAGKQPSQSL